MLSSLLTSACLAALLYAPGDPRPTIVYVDHVTGGQVQDGQSWDTAWHTLQDALVAAPSESNIEIHVAQGRYTPDLGGGHTPGNISVHFNMKIDVSILGGYAGNEGNKDNPGERNIHQYETILSGDLEGNDTDDGDRVSDNSTVILYSPLGIHMTEATRIDGVTIRDGNWPAGGGTGVSIEQGSPHFIDCTFTKNRAGFSSALAMSGGCFSHFERCRFIANEATNPSSTLGGAAFATLISNEPVFVDCLFRSNVSNVGGAVENLDGAPTFINCRFEGNVSLGEGGAIREEGVGGSTAIGCAFSGNQAGGNGGAIAVRDFVLLPTPKHSYLAAVINCTFAGNIAGIAEDHAGVGGGLYIGSARTSQPLISNSIVWGNADHGGSGSGLGAQIFLATSSSINARYSCVQEWAGDGLKMSDKDPNFVRPPSIESGDYGDLRPISYEWPQTRPHPPLQSPVIDSGVNGDVPLAVVTDVSGQDRFVDDPRIDDTGVSAAGSPVVDMGAYEGSDCAFDLGSQGPGTLRQTICDGVLRLTGGPAGAPVWLVYSLSAFPTPFKGGSLVPNPAGFLEFPLFLNGTGGLSLNVPPGLGPVSLCLQWLAPDAGVVLFSNAVQLTLP